MNNLPSSKQNAEQNASKSLKMGISNLIPTNQRSKEEAREIGRLGGIKSGEARRRKRDQKQILEMILALDIKTKDGKLENQMKKMGIPDEFVNYETGMAVSQIMKAIKGDTNAYKAVFDRVDGQPKSTQETVISGELTQNQRPYQGMSKEELRKLLGK